MGKPSANRPSFFKVMIGDFTKKLRIPSRFKQHLANLRGKSVLRSPRCGSWPVEVRRKNGDWFFKNGWEEFVSDHSIVHGDFLIFFHYGGYKFKVNIYGNSGCEKDTAPPALKMAVEKEYPTENRSNAGKKEKGKGISSEKIAACRPNKRKSAPIVGEGESPFLFGRKRVDDKRILLASRCLTTSNPCFGATMGMSNYKHVSIPWQLSKELDLTGKESVILQNPDGSSWFVNIVLRGGGFVKFGAGWSAFRRENCLTNGDVCFFEFLRKGVIHVHIFRDNEIGKPELEEDNTQLGRKSGEPIRSDAKEVTCNDQKRVLELANSFETDHSKYVAHWKGTPLYDLGVCEELGWHEQ